MSDLEEDLSRNINAVLERVALDVLPIPHSIDLDKHLGTISVTWMEEKNLDGSRGVIESYGPAVWTLHAASRPGEPILEFKDESGNTYTLWSHPEAFSMKLEVAP